jgi:perosamine synthetase
LKNRLHPLGAALVLAQFRRLPELIAQRRKNLEYFEHRLKGIRGVSPLPTSRNVTRGGYFRFLLKYHTEELNGLPIESYIQALRAEGVVEVAPGSMAKPLHLTRFFQTLEDGMYTGGWPRRGAHASRELVYRPGDFPRAERFSAFTLQFPAFTEPSGPIIDAYCHAMQKIASRVEHLLAHVERTRGGVNP